MSTADQLTPPDRRASGHAMLGNATGENASDNLGAWVQSAPARPHKPRSPGSMAKSGSANAFRQRVPSNISSFKDLVHMHAYTHAALNPDETVVQARKKLDEAKVARERGDILGAVRLCQSGVEMIDLALDAHAAAGPCSTSADGYGPIAEAHEDLSELRGQLQAKLDELFQAEMETETRLLYMPEVLVGVGFPGNPFARAEGGFGGGCDVRIKEDEMPTLLARLWTTVRRGDYVRTEWCLRVALATTLSCILALDVGGVAPTIFHGQIWMAVLATAQAKPTLGDSLDGWWIAVSGGSAGAVLTLLWLPLALSGEAGIYVAMFGAMACAVYLFGDHVQARWALLVLLVAHLNLMSSLPDEAPPLVSPLHTWQWTRVSERLVPAIFEVVFGFFAGGGISTLCLLFPFPRLATSQLAARFVESHQQAMRMHAVLTVAFVQQEVPNHLHTRVDNLNELLQRSLVNADNLLKVARWEHLLLRFFANGFAWPQTLARHAALLQAMAHNLQQRAKTKRAFRREAEHHKKLAELCGATMLEGVHQAALWSKILAQPLAGSPLPPPSELDRTLKALTARHDEAIARWGEAYQKTYEDSPSTWRVRNHLVHGEILLLHHQFNKELLSFQPEPEEEEQGSAFTMAMAFPGVFEDASRISRAWLALRTALTLALLVLVPQMVPTDAGGFDDAWAASDLLTEISIFSPIACIFVYQQRSQSMIPNLSRVWRFAFGTYLACAYAEWVIWLAGNHPVGTTQLESLRASQLGWVVAMMAASSVAGTFMHSGDYFGYTGLVVAFTVPIILIGWYWQNDEHDERRGLARMLQTVTGCTATVVLTLLVQTSHDRAETELRKRMAAAVGELGETLSPLTTANQELGKDRRVAHKLDGRKRAYLSLIEEASEELSLYPRPAFPKVDFIEAINNLIAAWEAALRVRTSVRSMMARAETDTEVIKPIRQQSTEQVLEVLKLFRKRASLLLASTQQVLDHVQRAVDPASPPPDSAFPPTLHRLQADIQTTWHEVDKEWAALVAQYLLADQGPRASADHLRNLAPVLTNSFGLGGAPPTVTAEGGAQPPPSSPWRGGQKPPLIAWLEMGQSISQLDYVCRHIAHLAERITNVQSKQSPALQLLPKPADLYQTQVVI